VLGEKDHGTGHVVKGGAAPLRAAARRAMLAAERHRNRQARLRQPPMRLVAWNCNMALHRKFAALRSLRPDVAVISECAAPARLGRRLDLTALSSRPVWIGRNPDKGLAVFAFNGFHARLIDGYAPSLKFIAPVRIDGPVAFNLLAVWAQNFSDGVRRKRQPGPLRLALGRYSDFLAAGPAVVAGDLNNNVFWDRPGYLVNHAHTVARLERHGLVSAYHASRGEPQGKETTPTHYWRDRTKDGPTYHIDYVFLPRAWMPLLREMQVGTFEGWCGSGLSDHVPLVVDVEP
jgi:exodeoxyribonuclease-3